MTIGERIRKIRKEKGLTQLCVALRMGMVSPDNVGAWERGLHIPSPKSINKVAKALGVSVAYLLEGVTSE